MTLAFSIKFPKEKKGLEGKPTNFIQKIWRGFDKDFPLKNLIDKYVFNDDGVEVWEINDVFKFRPKIHTMRQDSKNRWKKGVKIHPVINNRTKNRFQFAPTMVCSGIEVVKIEWFGETERLSKSVRVYIEGSEIGCGIWNKGFEDEPIFTGNQLFQLSENDGFDSLKDFFAWFNEDWEGKIIHWTDFRYKKNEKQIEVTDPVQVDPKTGKDRPCDCWLENKTCKCKN